MMHMNVTARTIIGRLSGASAQKKPNIPHRLTVRNTRINKTITIEADTEYGTSLSILRNAILTREFALIR